MSGGDVRRFLPHFSHRIAAIVMCTALGIGSGTAQASEHARGSDLNKFNT